MTKPSLTFTLDRQLQTEGQEPIRLAVTLNAWTSREQADVDENDVKQALAKASAQISADVFGDPQLKESCGDCRFWRVLDEQLLLERFTPPEYMPGTCHRHAPPFGHVRNTDWCGDFERAAK